jgi:hypothetical protein
MAVTNKTKKKFCVQSKSKTDDRPGGWGPIKTVSLTFCLPGRTAERDEERNHVGVTYRSWEKGLMASGVSKRIRIRCS